MIRFAISGEVFRTAYEEFRVAAREIEVRMLPAEGGPATGCARLLDAFVHEAKSAGWLALKRAKQRRRGQRGQRKPRSP